MQLISSATECWPRSIGNVASKGIQYASQLHDSSSFYGYSCTANYSSARSAMQRQHHQPNIYHQQTRTLHRLFESFIMVSSSNPLGPPFDPSSLVVYQTRRMRPTSSCPDLAHLCFSYCPTRLTLLTDRRGHHRSPPRRFDESHGPDLSSPSWYIHCQYDSSETTRRQPPTFSPISSAAFPSCRALLFAHWATVIAVCCYPSSVDIAAPWLIPKDSSLPS